ACMEDGVRIHPELIFSDISQVATRMAQVSEPADGVVMPDGEGVEVIQALKALGGKAERVVIGDDRVFERTRRPTAVVVKREDVVELVLSEMNRLLDEQTKSYRSLVVDCELHEAQ
ncbi:MAG TPA: hypothetical protein DCS97_16185, partial [Planctomycetes bacterium]|nr:hypothetical protein [Planctomycetota bacterium]